MLDDALREQLADWVRPVTVRRLQIMVGRAIAQGTRYTNSVVEFATRTGRLLAVVAPVVTSGFPGKVCVPLWSNPSGEQVMSYCGHGERYDHGRISPRSSCTSRCTARTWSHSPGRADFVKAARVHQVRLQGGDASSDSYCYRS